MSELNRLLQQPQPIVMGVLNITPDSFSDGGKLLLNNSPDKSAILAQAEMMINQGAGILDVGGESTRPGADPVSLQTEIDRVIPVVEWLAKEFNVPVSVDTSSPELMEIAVKSGVSMLNDVRAFQREKALKVAVQSNLPICVMHMQAEPQVMQENPEYIRIVDEVKLFLEQRIIECLQAGIKQHNIILDPGFGFGKTLKHNLDLFRGLSELATLGYPVLVGVSRKTMIGNILEKPVSERLYGSVAAALMAVQRGARIVRVHDVGATMDALRIMQAIES